MPKLPSMDQLRAERARMDVAYAEFLRIKKLNAPYTKENDRRKKSGQIIRRLPHVVDPDVMALIEAERKVKQKLKRRTPEGWRKIIDKLEGPARIKIALIVWWDYFSDGRRSMRSDALDDIITPGGVNVDCPEMADDDLVLAMVRVGYTARMALMRSETGQSYYSRVKAA